MTTIGVHHSILWLVNLPIMIIRCTTTRFLVTVVFASLAVGSIQAEEIVLHVSPADDDQAVGNESAPLATIHEAIERLAEIAAASPEGEIHVQLRGGTYCISTPLVLTRKHVPVGGKLTFHPAQGERVVISGGQCITDWTVHGDGTWSTSIPATAQRKWIFRELFVNGQRRPRARHPNAGYARIDKSFDDKRSGFTFNAGDLPENWISGGELVFLHDWSTSRIPVKSVAHDSQRLTVEFPIGNRADHYKIDHFEPHPRYFVENHRAFLDAPGEWLLDDAGTLTYFPLLRETPDTVEVIAPLVSALLIVHGDDEGPIRNVHFENLQFEHCAWPLPSGGFAASQATAFEQRGERPLGDSRSFVPPAVLFERAKDCSFTHGRLAHVGTSGIQFGSRTMRCRLEDSVIEDISGNGVNLGEDTTRVFEGRPWWQAAPKQAAAEHLVQHNRIERCGQQFFGAVAVWAGIARDMQIAHNEISHHPYTGISLGWMWNPTPTPAGGHVVSQNHIHHVMQVLSDGGGIYTLGRQPGLKLIENVIHDVPLNAGRAESNGMFLDEGSDQSEIVGNVIYAVSRSPLRFHRAEEVSVRSNTLVIPTPDTPSVRYNNTDAQSIKQLDNHVVLQAEFDSTTVALPPIGPRELTP